MADYSNFDWTQHDDGEGGGGLVPPGDYLVAVKGFKRVQRGRDTHLDFRMAILVAVTVNELEAGEVVSGSFFETVVLADRGIWKLVEIFKALQAPTTINLNSDGELAKATKSKPFLASIYQDEYNGKTRNKMDHALVMTPQAKALVDTAMEALGSGSNGGGHGGGYDPGDPGVEDRAGSGGRGGYTDDDVPF